MPEIARLGIQIEQTGAVSTAAALHSVTQAGAGAEASFGKLALQIAGYTSVANLAISGTRQVLTAVKDLGVESVKLAAGFERSRVTWGALLGDMERGAVVFERIRSFSAETPLSFEAANRAATTLSGFGAAAEDVIPILSRLGDVALGDNTKLQSLALVYGQVMAQGKAKTQDLYQFINAGVPIFNLLADSMNRSAGEIKELAAEGAVTFEEIEKAITKATSEGGKFHEMMNLAAETTEGKWSTAVDNFKQSLADLGERVLPMVNSALDTYNKHFEKMAAAKTYEATLSGKKVSIEELYASLTQYEAERARFASIALPGEDNPELDRIDAAIAVLERRIQQAELIDEKQRRSRSALADLPTAEKEYPFEYGWHGLNYRMPRDIRGATTTSTDYELAIAQMRRDMPLTLGTTSTTNYLDLFKPQDQGLITPGMEATGDVIGPADFSDEMIEKIKKQQQALKEYNSTVSEMEGLFKQVGMNAWVDAWESLGAAMYEGEFGAKTFAQAIQNVAETILNNLPLLLFQAGIQAMIAGQFWLGLGLIGASGLAGIGSGVYNAATSDNANGNVYSSPSLHAYSNKVYDKPQYFNFANGATIGRFAEAGMEAIMPVERMGNGRLGVSASTSSVSVPITIINSAPGVDVSAREVRASDGSRSIEMVVEKQVKRGIAGGRYQSVGLGSGARRST